MDLNVWKSVVHFVFGLEYAILKPVHVGMVAKKGWTGDECFEGIRIEFYS